MNTPEFAQTRDPLDRLAESFLDRFRRGERPSLEEYAAANPELAEDIRELFPALVEIEQLKSVDHPATAVDFRGRPEFSRLGDYQIIRLIGEGGMGVVYEAVRESLRSHVALKVMHSRFRSRSEYLRRFHNEARSAAQLHHTNIVPVFDYGEHDGVCYYAMQFIAGHGLDHVLADVRQLRSNQGPNRAELVATRPTSSLGEEQKVHRVLRDPAADRAVQDPLLRAVTDGLLTGRFSRVDGLAPDVVVPEPTTCEPTASAAHARTPGPGDLGLALRRPQVAKPPGVSALERPSVVPGSVRGDPGQEHVDLAGPVSGDSRPASLGHGGPRPEPRTRLFDPRAGGGESERNDPDSALSTSPSSLSRRGEDHYHREVARLGAQMAGALAYAHKRGVLHRDIKPSNLLLDATGNVWVTDFGLAKLEEGEDLSNSRDVVGTLRYMAPERLRGVSDRRCDIYALGATLYEMLTLRPVFDSNDRLHLIEQVVKAAPLPPRDLDRRIPRDLETIVLKALAKQPKDRFDTAEEMEAELKRFLEYRPIKSRPTSASERLWQSCKRNPVVAALIALSVALTVMIAIGSSVGAWTLWLQRDRAEQAERETRRALGESEASRLRGEAAKQEARLALGQSLISEGAALMRTGLVGQRFDSLDRLGTAVQVLGDDPEGQKKLTHVRNQAIAAMGLTDLRPRIERDCGDVFGSNVDATLERYTFVEKSGAVVVRRLADNRELLRLPGPDQASIAWAQPRFSPDGGSVVVKYEPGGGVYLLRLWHLGRRELLGSLSGRGDHVFDREGGRLLFGALDGGISIWDLRQHREVKRLPLDFVPSHMALDPDGRRVAVSNSDWEKPRVLILDLETSGVLADWRREIGTGALAWSADGQLLAVGGEGYDTRVYVWNVGRKELASLLRGHNGMIIGAQFAGTGFLLATSSRDGTTRLWDAVSGEAMATVPGDILGFSLDGHQAALRSVGGKIGIWEMSVGAECRTLHPGMRGNRSEYRISTEVKSADFSPNGCLLATSDSDGVRIWESNTGRELAQLNMRFCDTARFHPDGGSLISSGKWGLYRWPIQPDPDGRSGAIRIGPPELLWESGGADWSKATWLPDHRNLALIDNANARVLLVDSLHPHPAWSRSTVLDSDGNKRMTTVGVSPDGRWLAAGGWYEEGIRVWDLQRRRFERHLKLKDVSSITKFFAGFSPDGRWLVSCIHPDVGKYCYQFWHVGTWEPGLRIEHERSGTADFPPAFSHDGRLMALGIAPDQVLLAEVATGREIARLTTLQYVTPKPLAFSRDGTKLIAATQQRTALVWDLRRIRDQLSRMGLDWEAPSYPAESAASEDPASIWPVRSVRVMGEVIEPRARRAVELAVVNGRLAAKPNDAEFLMHRGWLFHQEKKWPEAIADLERRLSLGPDDRDALFLLARVYQQSNNLTGANAILETYLKRFHEDIDAWSMKCSVSLGLNRLREAAAELSKVLAVDPGRVKDRGLRARIWFRLERFPEALNDLNTLIQQYPHAPSLYTMRSQIHDRLGHNEQAQADMERAVDCPLASAEEFNNLAWRLATSPLVALRNPEQALILARKAMEMAPGTATYLNTLGVAQYRVGRYGEAVATLEKSLAASKGQSDAHDLFFLAMARHQLGRIAAARADFEGALRWWTQHPNQPPDWAEELDRFRAEAEMVLSGSSFELPANVFAPISN